MSTIMFTNTDAADLSPMLSAIRAANINVLYSYRLSVLTDSEITAFLDDAAEAGLRVMLSVRERGKNVVKDRVDKTLSEAELAALTEWCATFVLHPAFWGWYADDEGTAAEYPLSTRQQVYDTLKALDSTKPVVEVHYEVTAAYSADVHDLFGIDIYPYVYNTFPTAPHYGCLSQATGLVTDTNNETLALEQYETDLATIVADTTAGDGLFVLMQAFGQGADGTLNYWGMPPATGLDKMWAIVRNQGFDWSAAWFLWDSNDTYTMPGENLNGINTVPARVTEMAAIAAANDDSYFDLATEFAWDKAEGHGGVDVGAVGAAECIHYLAIESSRHPASSPEVTLTGKHNLTIGFCTHRVTSPTVSLTSVTAFHILAIDSCRHTLTSPDVDVATQPVQVLAIDSSRHRVTSWLSSGWIKTQRRQVFTKNDGAKYVKWVTVSPPRWTR